MNTFDISFIIALLWIIVGGLVTVVHQRKTIDAGGFPSPVQDLITMIFWPLFIRGLRK